MGFREDVPKVSRYLERIEEIVQLYEATSFEQAVADMSDPRSDTRKHVLTILEAKKRLNDIISKHELSKNVKKSFIEDVERSLKRKRVDKVRINIFNDSTRPLGIDEWFGRRVFSEGSPLDETVWYWCNHPDLGELARQNWGNNPRVIIDEPDFLDGKSIVEEKVHELKRHGFPSELSTWEWAADSLRMAAIALQRLGLAYKLSDYVEWTCTGEPPELGVGEIFGEPSLYSEAVFEDQIPSSDDLVRLGGVKIWKSAKGTFVSPLWEYLSWRGSEGYGELGEYARTAGAIGEGLDAAITPHDREFDPDDNSRLRLAPARIFHAGEAVVRLKVKLEFDEYIRRGRSDSEASQRRTRASGRKSRKAREARREALLGAMEDVVRRMPEIAALGPDQIAKVALKKCIEQNASLWSVGRGQISEYLGEIRRGDKGLEALKVRYDALFPPKPLKRSPLNRQGA
ncbi:hypothetical protein [Alkalilacustris brevis]|uniref:hypothetical protein n=1 Tax=Alkalilacustris brevis TaxID=2026338 RepID=UPI0012D365F3|nr:hypothetical protein [Alkalilacustris brevis]